MAYLIYNDKYYIEKSGGKFNATSNFDRAFKASADVLQSYIDNQISKKERHLYKIVEADGEVIDLPIDVKSDEAKDEPEITETVSDLNEDNITALVNSLFSLVRDNKINVGLLTSYSKFLHEELDHVNGQITDYYHYIEFNDLSASSGFKVYKDLKRTLIHRRNLKDSISKLDLLIKLFKNDYYASTNIVNYLEPEDRSYTARELPELFD